MIERHQDYQLTIPRVNPGGMQNLPLKLDTDAPFALRLVSSRNIGLNGWRFTTPRQAYQSNALRTDLIVPVAAGAGAYASRGSIIYEEMVYPPGATINIDVGNATGQTLTNAILLFRGSKLYTDASQWAPTYPERMAVLPSIYQVVVPQVGLTETRRDIQLVINNDADFVYRWGVCDAWSLTQTNPQAFQFTELYVTLRDEQRKAYSNAPIHVNELFGQGLPTPLGTGANDDQVLFTPGLMTPEIYLPRKHSLYFDVVRNDSSGVPIDLYFRFGGMKVFQR
jgi:hypothetical protein